MTDQDNLRNRIKQIIDLHDERFFDDDYPSTLAQAIIDELRLEREVSPINVDCVRYVSKWELRKH